MLLQKDAVFLKAGAQGSTVVAQSATAAEAQHSAERSDGSNSLVSH